jgi:hypothetical protein
MNIPGSEGYHRDLNLPWVMKWNKLAKAIIGDVSTFVDDTRASGFDFENTWQVSCQFAVQLQYLGIQDAPRK